MPAWLITTVALSAINIVCLAIGLAVSDARPVAATVGTIAGAVLWCFGTIWLLKLAASESIGTLLMVLFLPVYTLCFIGINWKNAGKPFTVSCLGNLLALLASLLFAPSE